MQPSPTASLNQPLPAPDRARIWNDLATMVSFHSVHGSAEDRADYEAGVDWLVGAFGEVGVDLEAIACVDDSVALVGQRPGAAGAPRVLLYAHHDVVPAGDLEEWDQSPTELHAAVREDGTTRWHGRGTADCKGNIAMHLAALRALGAEPATAVAPVTVVIEGSEENGGAGLSDLLARRPELFDAEVIVVADTGNAAVGEPCLVTQLRGSAQIRVTCKTLSSPAHSGKFGGVAPDATAALMRALDSLRDEKGRTRIEGVDCHGHWRGGGYDPERFAEDAGVLDGVELIGEPDAHEVADGVWAHPAVTVTGFSSTPVDEAVNAVPAEASAQVNLRVPPRLRDTAGRALSTMDTAELLARHLHAHVPWGAHLEVDIQDTSTGYTAATTPAGDGARSAGRAAEPAGKPAAGRAAGPGALLAQLRECLGEAYGREAHEIGTGGSIPLTVELHERFPEAAIALLGVADTSAAIHSPEESVDPTEIEAMAIAEALFLRRLAQ